MLVLERKLVNLLIYKEIIYMVGLQMYKDVLAQVINSLHEKYLLVARN
jgi:hypothetical protein